MYHGVGAATPTCAPQEIIDEAKRQCATQIRGVGALPGPWAGQDPCGVATLHPCLTFVRSDLLIGGGEPTEEPGGGYEEEPRRSGAVMIGGILLLLVAAGGGYYIYRRAKRKV